MFFGDDICGEWVGGRGWQRGLAEDVIATQEKRGGGGVSRYPAPGTVVLLG